MCEEGRREERVVFQARWMVGMFMKKGFVGLINYHSTLLSFDTNYIICKECRKYFYIINFIFFFVKLKKEYFKILRNYTLFSTWNRQN